MHSVSDRRPPANAPMSTRGPARPGSDGMRASVAPAHVPAVTLNKIGDFLELDFTRVFAWIYAGRKLALVLAATGFLAGVGFGVLAPAKYTVSTDVLIDPANLQVVTNDLFQQPAQVDAALLSAGSKLRVMTSRNVLERVVAELDLANDPEFYDPNPGLSLRALLPAAKEEPNPQLAALAALGERVATEADETSFVATLLVTTESAEKSIRIADAMVRAFQDELAAAEADSAARTATALNDRLNELKGAVKAAEDRVEAYKREHNLLSTAGELLSAQTMSQLTTQVVAAQSQLISAQSAYDELVAAGTGAVTAETQSSPALTTLRASAGSLTQQLNAQSTIYGPRHPTIVRLRTELAAVNAQVEAEFGRVVAAARARVDEAQAALDALQRKAGDLTGTVFTDNEALVTLRELERDAASSAAIYEAFLARARQVTEREQIDATNVRVISEAVPPPARSWPPRTLLLAILGAVGGLGLGLMIATGIGIGRDLRRPAPRRRLATA